MFMRKMLAVLSGLVLSFVAGCGETVNPNAPATLKGKVTYNGAAVTGGSIVLSDGTQNVQLSQIGHDGTYAFTNAPTGDFTVVIETESLNKKKVTYGVGQGGKDNKGGGMSPVPEGASGTTVAYVKIPVQYANPQKSPLKVTLARGQQTKDFDLKD